MAGSCVGTISTLTLSATGGNSLLPPNNWMVLLPPVLCMDKVPVNRACKRLEERGLVQISDADAVQPAVVAAVSDNPSPVADYLAGKEVAMKFLVGQVMKITRGKANPQLVAEMLKDRLESMR